jgi:hypothetical protein
MTTTNLWFIESNEYDDVLTSINIDDLFEEEKIVEFQQLELFEELTTN